MDGEYSAHLPGANAVNPMDGEYSANLPGANAVNPMGCIPPMCPEHKSLTHLFIYPKNGGAHGCFST